MSTPPLAKHLASNDKKVRDKAVKNLAVFLSDPSSALLEKPEIDKLWKGIFYGFWMSDKPLVQQALATELADLVLTITSTSASLAFLRGFWIAMVREWNGIDRLRIDKYYMLVRRFVNVSFRLLMRNGWSRTACDEYNDIISGSGGPLCPSDIKVPTGLVYHLCDIYVEELDKAMGNPPSDAPSPLPPAPLNVLLQPFYVLAAQTPANVTFKRVQSALLGPLFSALPSQSSDLDSESEERAAKRVRLATEIPSYNNLLSNASSGDSEAVNTLQPLQLRKELLRGLFDIASQPEARESNRKKILAQWKAGNTGEEDT